MILERGFISFADEDFIMSVEIFSQLRQIDFTASKREMWLIIVGNE